MPRGSREKAACQQLNTCQTTNTFIVTRKVDFWQHSLVLKCIGARFCIETVNRLHSSNAFITSPPRPPDFIFKFQQYSFLEAFKHPFHKQILAVVRVEDTGFVFAQRTWFWNLTLGRERFDPAVQHKSNTSSSASAHLYFNKYSYKAKQIFFWLYPRPGTSLSHMKIITSLERFVKPVLLDSQPLADHRSVGLWFLNVCSLAISPTHRPRKRRLLH